MGTNEGWPEAFGFSVTGGAPVQISEVEDGGSAQQAGLQPGDAIIELDGVCVEQWSRIQVVDRARCSVKVPPSLVVMSRVRQFSIPCAEDGGFGITLRGNSPVFVRSVDFPSPARTAGVKSGDLLLEVNWDNVRFCSKSEVLKRIKKSGRVLHLMVVAGGLGTNPRSSIYSEMSSEDGDLGGRVSGGEGKTEQRVHKAKVFHSKVNYYLMNDETKKSHLLTLLRLYSRDRDVNSLGQSLDLLLDTPIERRLLSHIRSFVPSAHHKRFDTLVSYTPDYAPSHRRGSCDLGSPTRYTATMERNAQWRSSMPDLTSIGERTVRVYRGNSGFGFTLSGNSPVFIRSVDSRGAAALAGLRTGDRILQLNGLDIRNSTHSHVVRLLRGSGTRPTLVVSSAPSIRPSGVGMGAMGTLSSAPVINSGIKKNSRAFKDKMEQVLVEGDRKVVVDQLGQFSKHRNLPDLVEGLGEVLNDRNKIVLYHYICQLLPEETQNEFDRIAAGLLSGDSRVTQRSDQPHGNLPSLSFGGRGDSTPSGGSHDPGGRSHGFSMGGASLADEPGMFLQDTPIRGTARREQRSEESKKETKEDQSTQRGGTAETKSNDKQDALKTPTNELSTISTPGGIPLPPNPPPTPHTGVGGVPVPPPPPPTLPGGASQASRLRRVNWEKVHGTEGTIWGELSGLEDALEYFELEQQFASQKPKGPSAAGQGTKKQTSILESRKAYNISILLGHLKLPFNDIREAILKCDDSVLSEQHLRQLEAFAPDKNECLGFTRFHDNPSSLSLPDKFSCEMSTIPCYQQRLRAMVFKLHFKDKVEEIKPDLEAICLAAVQLQSSKNFKKILEIVLAVGNYMNAGNVRVGGATGFRISYLTQLKALRTTDNKSTLLHFVAGTAERKFPEALEFPDDLSFICKAARVSGQTLEIEMNELTQGLKDIRRDIHEINSQEKLPDDRFESVMTTFTAEADQDMAGLLKLYSKMKQEYQTAVKFFGEDSIKMRVDDFFGAFAAFISDFEKAVLENKTQREKQVLMERRLQERNEVTKKKGSSFSVFRRTNSKEKEMDLRRELEVRSKSKSIDVVAIERQRDPSVTKPEQHDFRHLLRQTDHLQQPNKQDEPVSIPGQSGLKPVSIPGQSGLKPVSSRQTARHGQNVQPVLNRQVVSGSHRGAHRPIGRGGVVHKEEVTSKLQASGSQDYDYETQF